MTDTPKNKFKRKLTPFLCQEMLYDYAIDRLDGERKTAIDEFLKTDKECQGILDGIRQGIALTETLARTRLKPEIAAHLRDSENVLSLGRKYSSWKEWPEALRWSITAITLSTVVALVVAVIPWKKLPSLRGKRSDSIEIAQLGKSTDKQLEELKDHQEGDLTEQEGSGDEEIEPTDTSSPPPAKVAVNPPPNTAKSPTPVATGEDNGDNGGEDSEEPSAPVESEAPTTDNGAAAHTRSDAKAKGFVYRAFMTLGNLDEIGPKIVDNIVELGGEKAGEVELGWKRGTGRYYHFALPGDNEEKLLERLRAYGPVRISKDPHPRVMPNGQIRVILWVEAGNL